MPIELPELPPVDRTREGYVRIALPALAYLLRLPAGHEIVDFSTEYDSLELRIQGADMPPRGEGEPVKEVSLLGAVECDGGRERKYIFWSHLPEKRWLLSDLPVES